MGHRGMLTALAVAVALVGCGDDDGVSAADPHQTTGELTERNDPDSPNPVPVAVRFFRDVAGLDMGGPLPTSVDEIVAGSEAVVVGTLTSVDRGVAVDQSPGGMDPEGQALVDWNDDDVDFWTLHVDVVADEVLKGDIAVGDDVPIAMTVYPTVDPGLVADGVRAIGDRVLLFLDLSDWELDPGRWRVGIMSALYATVGPDEDVNLPFWPDEWPPLLRQSMPTLAEVRAASS